MTVAGNSNGTLEAWTRAAACGVAVLAVAFLAGCKSEAKPPRVQAQPVQVMTVEASSSMARWSYVGTIRARHEAEIAFRVGGKVMKRHVDVGQRVDAGHVIAELDPTDYRLAVEAQAAELTAAKSSRDQAVAAEDRFRVLHGQGHVAKAALDQRVAAADEARGRVERAERSLFLARNQLAYATLRSEVSGVVAALPVEAGQVVTPGQTIARIAQRDELELLVAIPENRLEDIRIATAEIEVWGAGARRVAAKLRELSPDADRASRTYAARFTIAAPELGHELGRTATVHLSLEKTAETFAVPLSAVMRDRGNPSVWLLDKAATTVRRANVTLVGMTQDTAFVMGALETGDQIVTMGVHMLDEAKSVRVVERRASVR